MIEEAIRKLLTNAPAIASAVRTAAGTYKIRPSLLDQSDKPQLPAIVYHVIDSQSEEHLCGAAGMAQTRFQFDCYAASEIEARSIRESVRLALQGFRGSVTTNNRKTEILGSSVAGRRNDIDAPNDGTGQLTYIAMIDFLFTHRETVGITTT